MANSDEINSFHLIDFKFLFFDIFYKNNNIYLICPINSMPFEIEKLCVSIDQKSLDISNKVTKQIEPQVHILSFEYISDLDKIIVNVKYDDKEQIYNLIHIKTVKKYFLSICTLFKDDYLLFPLFYRYYKEQGVSFFIMYYNGIFTNEIREVFNMSDVLLLEWNFQYWGHIKGFEPYAQTGQLQHSLYKYSKDISEYLICCDFDEYFSISNKTLLNFIQEYPEVDVFGFCHKWSKTLDDKIPTVFPSCFYTSRMHRYGIRNKNIYKTDSVLGLDVHSGTNWTKNSIKIIKELRMFHFYNWSGKVRTFTEISDIINI